MKQLVMLLILLSGFNALAYKSAHRDPNEPWQKAYQRSMQEYERVHKKKPYSKNAQEMAVKIDKLDASKVTVWGKSIDLFQAFTTVRDIRFMTTDDRPQFLRRISWQYPDDGCFARAAMVVSRFNEWKVAPPSKIFIFGDLTVQTNNSPDGKVSWWYHVAPVVNYSGQVYVLDAAISPGQPLPLVDWVKTMTNNIQRVKIAYCHPDSYVPGDRCLDPSSDTSNDAITDQRYYLGQEWRRAEEMGRDPSKVLGEEPPWKKTTRGFLPQ